MSPLGFCWVALAALCLPLCSLQAAKPLPILTTAAQVRALSPAAADDSYPVRLRGVITYHDPSHFLCFVQDPTGGIYLLVRDCSAAPGDLVEVEGVSGPGIIGRIVTGKGGDGASVKVLGREPLPKPTIVRGEDLDTALYDAQWVAVECDVLSVRVENGRAFVDLQCGNRQTRAVLPGFHSQDAAPMYLKGLQVVVHGVVGVVASSASARLDTYLCVPSLREIVPSSASLSARFDVPIKSYGEFYEIRAEGNAPMVRLQGKVTFVETGVGFMMLVGKPGAWEGNIWVQTTQPDEIQNGAAVDVLGRPEWVKEFGSLKSALFRKVEGEWALQPRLVSSLSELNELHHGEFIRFSATLLESPFVGLAGIIALNRDNKVLFARLPRSLPVGWKLPPSGSVVEVTGVFLERAFPALALPASSDNPHILLRDANELRLIALPSWWTPKLVRGFVATLLGAVGAALVWGITLRRRVSAQTQIIRHQFEQAAIHEERTRLARELHDTIEQNLVAVGIQLDAIARHLPPEMIQPRRLAEMAHEMVSLSREEVREAVWELRRNEADREELPMALKMRLGLLSENSGLGVEFNTVGEARSLLPETERHLLRCALEAATNALKHSRCGKLFVELRFGPEMIELTVRDDGCGFDTTVAGNSHAGHFGFRGLQERAAKIGGRLFIQSTPGVGTTVRIEAPTGTDASVPLQLAPAS